MAGDDSSSCSSSDEEAYIQSLCAEKSSDSDDRTVDPFRATGDGGSDSDDDDIFRCKTFRRFQAEVTLPKRRASVQRTPPRAPKRTANGRNNSHSKRKMSAVERMETIEKRRLLRQKQNQRRLASFRDSDSDNGDSDSDGDYDVHNRDRSIGSTRKSHAGDRPSTCQPVPTAAPTNGGTGARRNRRRDGTQASSQSSVENAGSDASASIDIAGRSSSSSSSSNSSIAVISNIDTVHRTVMHRTSASITRRVTNSTPKDDNASSLSAPSASSSSVSVFSLQPSVAADFPTARTRSTTITTRSRARRLAGIEEGDHGSSPTSEAVSVPAQPPSQLVSPCQSRSTGSALTIDLVDSSSDDDDSDSDSQGGRVALQTLRSQGVNQQSIDVLERSRLAAVSLKNAQAYSPDDSIEILDSDDDGGDNVGSTKDRAGGDTPNDATSRSLARDLGRPLKLVCRTMVEVNGKKKRTEKRVTIELRQREPFRHLRSRLLEEYRLPPTSRVTLHFDGDTLSGSKTPTDVDMEDGDLLDVKCQTIRMPLTSRSTNVSFNGLGSRSNVPADRDGHSAKKQEGRGRRRSPRFAESGQPQRSQQRSQSIRSAPSSIGPVLQLCLQRREVVPNQRLPQVSQIKLSHGAGQPLEGLLVKYRQAANLPSRTHIQFKFDGDVMSLRTTPAMHDMESGDLIDVVIS